MLVVTTAGARAAAGVGKSFCRTSTNDSSSRHNSRSTTPLPRFDPSPLPLLLCTQYAINSRQGTGCPATRPSSTPLDQQAPTSADQPRGQIAGAPIALAQAPLFHVAEAVVAPGTGTHAKTVPAAIGFFRTAASHCDAVSVVLRHAAFLSNQYSSTLSPSRNVDASWPASGAKLGQLGTARCRSRGRLASSFKPLGPAGALVHSSWSRTVAGLPALERLFSTPYNSERLLVPASGHRRTCPSHGRLVRVITHCSGRLLFRPTPPLCGCALGHFVLCASLFASLASIAALISLSRDPCQLRCCSPHVGLQPRDAMQQYERLQHVYGNFYLTST